MRGFVWANYQQKLLEAFGIIGYNSLATQVNRQFTGEVFLLLVKMHSLYLHFSCRLQTCVAQAGVMRFSVRSFGCALFYYEEKEK